MKDTMAQDQHYSQFYANPLYLNPSLAGANLCPRLLFNYRNQWPSLPNSYKNYSCSFDSYFKAISGGAGVLFNNDKAGDGNLSNNRISFIYAYKLKISHNTYLQTGFEGTYSQYSIDWNNFVFGDMIDMNSGMVNQNSTGEAPPSKTSLGIADFSTGFVINVNKFYYAGLAVHHLSEPQISFYPGSSDNTLFRKYTFHAGASIDLTNNAYKTDYSKGLIFSPNILYQQQKNARQFAVGLYLNKFPFVGGIWIRNNFVNFDALIALIGIQHKNIKFGYSYDLTISRIGNVSGGAHEVSTAVHFRCAKKRNQPGAIKCPEF